MPPLLINLFFGIISAFPIFFIHIKFSFSMIFYRKYLFFVIFLFYMAIHFSLSFFFLHVFSEGILFFILLFSAFITIQNSAYIYEMCCVILTWKQQFYNRAKEISLLHLHNRLITCITDSVFPKRSFVRKSFLPPLSQTSCGYC